MNKHYIYRLNKPQRGVVSRLWYKRYTPHALAMLLLFGAFYGFYYLMVLLVEVTS